ncbi:MAG TPA: SPFH domain-containing protein, partial [bacterium]|nr:SPFH domain-containing protein [bacterium]
MGLFKTLKNEVKREFIARPDDSKDLILYKWPDQNIRLLTQLTVQPDEIALFVKKGEVVGTLEAGTHTLDGASIPFLSALIDKATGGNFLMSELYFVSTREFTNLPFGGMIDNVLDPMTNLAVGIRLFGEYSIKATSPEKLISNLVGTQGITNNDSLTEWSKNLLLKVFRETVSDYVTNEQGKVLGIASKGSEFEQKVMPKIRAELENYGLVVAKIGNVTITIKEEDEAILKQLTRDVAYTHVPGAADTAVKLGMADNLKSGGSAGNTMSGMTAAGMGMAMGMNMAN